MADRTIKPDDGNDLVLQNNHGDSKIEVNEDDTVVVTSGGNFTVDATGDIILDADGADVTLKDGGTTFGTLKQSSGHLVIQPTSSKEIILNDQGGTATLTVETSNQNVTVEAGNLVIGSAGKGIDFSNQTTATGGSPANQAELLDHFETGTFTPNIVNYDGSQFADFSSSSKGVYTRVGDLICVSIYLAQTSYTAQRVAADAYLTNLPFTPYNSTGSLGQVATGVIQNTRSSFNSGSADDDVITLRYTSHLSGSFTLYYKDGQVIEEGNFQDGSDNSKSVSLHANFSYRSQ